MNKVKLVVFDLDGTLVKSYKTIYDTAIFSLKKMGIESSTSLESFTKMIGLHFVDIFEKMGIRVDSFEEFISIYKSHYFDFINSSELYPNVIPILSALNSNGTKVALLTTKGQEQADLILSYLKLDNYFDLIRGRRDGIKNKPDPEPLLLICEDLDIPAANTIFVGDSEMDIKCGKNAGAITCGVTFGYRTRSQIKYEDPDYVIDDLNELHTII